MRPSVRRALERLMARAAAAPVPYAEMFRRAAEHQAGRLPAADHNLAHTRQLADGLRITYTLEEHRPGVMCRHLSASGPSDSLPDLASLMATVGLVARALGFQHPPGAQPGWFERTGDGRLAFNMVEPVSGDLAELARDDGPPH